MLSPAVGEAWGKDLAIILPQILSQYGPGSRIDDSKIEDRRSINFAPVRFLRAAGRQKRDHKIMRQQWVALLSVLGLTGSGVRVQSQVLKGSTQPTTKQKPADPKLGLKQETLRQQNTGSATNAQLTPPPPGQSAKTPPPSAGAQNNALTKGNSKLNVKQETLRQQNTGSVNPAKNTPNKAVGQNTGTCRYSEGCQTAHNQALTKGNQALTKGNQPLTKGNQAITKDNQAITKGNQALTKGNQAITKDNQAITKGNQAITKNNQAITKGSQAVPK